MADPKIKKPRQSNPGALLCIVAVALVVFMCLFIYTGPMKKFAATRAELQDLEGQLKSLETEKRTEQARLSSQEKVMALIKERKPNFDLWTFVNTVLTETKLKDRANLENYKPRAEKRNAAETVTMVQLRLNNVLLAELVDMLHKVYSSNNLIVLYRMEYLRPSNDNKGLECNLTFLTPKA